MQFSTVAILAASVASASAAVANVTVTNEHSTLVTITSCGPEVTECPLHSSSVAPVNGSTAHNVSTFEAGANKQFAAGAVALAAGALLAL